MAIPETKYYEVSLVEQDKVNIHNTKFIPIDYCTEYTPSWTNSFRRRTELLWTIIMADRKGKNELGWAKCCLTLERKTQKGLLGHPKDLVIPVGRLLSEHGIKTYQGFHDLLAREMPKNDDRDSRLPQVNMKHPFKTCDTSDANKPVQTECLCKVRATDSMLLGLEAQIYDLDHTNAKLRDEIQDLKVELKVL